MIERARLDRANEIASRRDVGHDGAFEAANGGFEGVARVKEDDVITSFVEQLMQFSRSQSGAAANDAVTRDFELTPRHRR